VRTVVIGVGNAFRGDDAVGLAVAERVRERAAGLEVIVCEQEPVRLLDAWAGADLALLVDAVSSGAEPGTVHRLDATRDAVPATVFRGSTHAFGVAEVVELGRALGRLPERLLVFGVEGAEFRAGRELTPGVAAAVEPLVQELLEEAGCTSAR
jgi:hydrogenase maturation protease